MFLITITGIGIGACANGFGYHKKDVHKAGGDLQQALLVRSALITCSSGRLTTLQCFFLFQIFYKVREQIRMGLRWALTWSDNDLLQQVGVSDALSPHLSQAECASYHLRTDRRCNRRDLRICPCDYD